MATQDRVKIEAAYRATSYFVDGPNGRFAVRVGRPPAQLDALLAAHGVETWMIITAFNPGSVPTPSIRNEARQRDLETVVAESGRPFFRGEGQGDDGAWAPETSLLVLGVSSGEAVALARDFGQLAVVFGKRGGAARLLWTDENEK
jgi:hypothetical protein